MSQLPSQEGAFKGIEKFPPTVRGPGRRSNAHPLTEYAEYREVRRVEGRSPVGQEMWEELWALFHARMVEKEEEDGRMAEAMRTGRCRWGANATPCDAPVYWLSHERTGATAPIDAAPVEDGNVLADLEAGTYSVLGTVEARERARQQGLELRKNHWATCTALAAQRSRREVHRS